MAELQQTKDTCVEHLTTIEGKELEIMANLVSADQIDTVIKGRVCMALGSEFGVEMFLSLLRCSVSWKGRGREGIENIGKTPDVPGQFMPKVTDI